MSVYVFVLLDHENSDNFTTRPKSAAVFMLFSCTSVRRHEGNVERQAIQFVAHRSRMCMCPSTSLK